MPIVNPDFFRMLALLEAKRKLPVDSYNPTFQPADVNPFAPERDVEANPFATVRNAEVNPFRAALPEGYNPFTRSPENPFTGLSPEPPPTKKPTREMLRDILSSSLYSFGQGLLAASKAPVGSQSMAAFGGAVSAPYEREMSERKMRSEEARQALYESQAQQAMANAAAIPERERTRWAEIENRLKIAEEKLAAGRPVREAQARRLHYLYTPAGLIDLSGEQPSLIAGTGLRTQMEVTPEIATALGLPSEMVGRRMTAQEINQVATAAQRPLRVIPTAEGVMAYNLVTGERQKIGDIPPARAIGSFIPQVSESGEITGYFNPQTGRVVGQPQEFAGGRKTGLPVGEVGSRVTIENLLEDAGFIEQTARQNSQAIGPVAGRITAMLHQYGPSVVQQMFPELTKPEVIEMYRVALNIRNQLLYALSGKQINEREYQRLEQLVPAVNTSPEVFQSRLNAYRNELQRTLAKRQGETAPARKTVGTVRMRTPDGKVWDIPSDKVEAARKRGAVEVK